jgi:uncharacterized OB-fold protein
MELTEKEIEESKCKHCGAVPGFDVFDCVMCSEEEFLNDD